MPPPSATFDLDLFTDPVLENPYPTFAQLRSMGPAVYLTRHQVWAVPRHDDVRRALTDSKRFSSVGGVALTAETNQTILAGTVLASDGLDHARLRRVLSKQLAPRAVGDLASAVQTRADARVRGLVEQGTFDAVDDLARPFVADTVFALMGLSAASQDWLVGGAAQTFDMFGPSNARYERAAPAVGAMFQYLTEHVTPDSVRPDSWLGAIFDAVRAGEIAENEAVPLMSAYTTAGMDTTIHGIATAIALLAAHPDQFAALREDRVTAEAVFAEALRYDAPITAFGRRVTQKTKIGDVTLDKDECVWLLYGSAGRDALKWGPTADAFDVHRKGADQHLALGAGPHSCAGNHLAILQARAILSSLATYCTSLKISAPPTRRPNNVLRGWEHVPLSATSGRTRFPDSQVPSPVVDTSKASPARLYDLYNRGKDNYAVDRHAAKSIAALGLDAQTIASSNRGFHGRAIRFLASELGYDQFLDIGVGLPSTDNTHEIAQADIPTACVVYVDNDPIVLRHAEALLTSGPDGKTFYVHTDLRNPKSIVTAAKQHLDFTRPIALCLIAVLHFLEDTDNPKGIVETLLASLPKGSCLVITHVTDEYAPETWRAVEEIYRRQGITAQSRSEADIAHFFDGLDLVTPGVLPVHLWRPNTSAAAETDAAKVSCLGGIGIKSHHTTENAM